MNRPPKFAFIVISDESATGPAKVTFDPASGTMQILDSGTRTTLFADGIANFPEAMLALERYKVSGIPQWLRKAALDASDPENPLLLGEVLDGLHSKLVAGLDEAQGVIEKPARKNL